MQNIHSDATRHNPTRWPAAIRPRAIVTACVALRRRANILQSILVCTLSAKPKNEYFAICTRTGMRALPLGAVLADQRMPSKNIPKSPPSRTKTTQNHSKINSRTVQNHTKNMATTWSQPITRKHPQIAKYTYFALTERVHTRIDCKIFTPTQRNTSRHDGPRPCGPS